MLLNFSFGNFRSFSDKVTLSMIASPQTTHNHILIREGNHRILPAAILYGANASGKSNIILAMQTLHAIIQNGTISSINNSILSRLELFPFIHDGNEKPIILEIEFIENSVQFIYRIAFGLTALSQQRQRSIEEESLSLITQNKKIINLFSRTKDNIELGHNKLALKYLAYEDTDILQKLVASVVQNMDEMTPFLTGGFRSTISKSTADIIINYITNKISSLLNLSTIEHDSIIHNPDMDVPEGEWMLSSNFFETISKAADFGPQIIGLRPKKASKPDAQELELASIYEYRTRKSAILSSLMESVGTIRLLHFALRLREAFLIGGVFLIDEMDNSIHPEITKAILAIFCNPDINKKGAQLIFTSHNPIFMDRDLLRRDQIIFVEKDTDTYKSNLYALSDFGSVSVRNDQDFIRNYFKGRYGKLPYIDLEEILLAAMEEKNEQTN